MVKCCIPGCRSSSKDSVTDGVRLHRFPTKNLLLRREWISFALRSGTKLARLDMTDRNNTRLCSHHFIDKNRDSNPIPTILPPDRDFEEPVAGSREAVYMADLEMENLPQDKSMAYTFPADGQIDIESFLDAKLAELDVVSLLDKAVEKLDIKLKQQERKTREVNQIFTHCETQMKQLKQNIEADQGIVDDGYEGPIAVGDSDSDDDVQVVRESYDPKIAARHQQQRLKQQHHRPPGPHRFASPMQTQHTYMMRGGQLVRTPHQASVGVRPHSQMINMSGKPYPNTRFSAPQLPGPRSFGPRSMQTGPRVLGDPSMQGQQRPHTTMYLPPTKHADLVVGMKLFGKKFNDIWYKGTLIEIHDKEKPRTDWRYRIKFDYKGLKALPGREIAFVETPVDTLPVGSRVIALYKDEEATTNTAHYAGIVAESPSLRNSQRYLIFFDDGYAQYCTSKEIHKVYEQSRNVWEDIHPDSQEFIKSYLKQYPERPMVRLQPNQIIKTEWNGRWWTARVLVTDASLVKMYFDADKRVEWIYRGSTRLEPLYTELANAEMSKVSGKGHRRHHLSSNKKPVVEYLRGTDEDFRKQPTVQAKYKPLPQAPIPNAPTMQRMLSQEGVKKKGPVARKSTSKSQLEIPERPQVDQRPRQFHPHMNHRIMMAPKDMIKERLTSDFLAEMHEAETTDERIHVEMGWKDTARKPYVPHRCQPKCLRGTELDPGKFKGFNPLIIPMLSGWERQIARQKNNMKRAVFYRGPCGRRMRSVEETKRYLKDTHCKITIDMFCYDMQLRTHSEFTPIKTFCDIKDLSYGKETVPISCVNGTDRQYPDYVEYSNQRIPAEGVHLNLDPDFLVGCDCKDDECGDPEKCSCAALTLEASKAIPGPRSDLEPEYLGYQYRRLKEPITTGIYECNQRCKCSSRCNNRVAQNPLALRLQVFKTEKRGWGLRSLDDIPAGGFICVYAGQLLTEQGANEDGQQYGDEYLAELDYIEVVERTKDGYESDVDINLDDEGIEQDKSQSEDNDDDGNYNAHSDSDSTFSGEKYVSNVNTTGTPERKSNRKRAKKGDDDKDKKSTKIVIKRGADQDNSWSVKTPMKSPQAKTKEWVDSIPDPQPPAVIVLSDEEDGGGSGGKSDKKDQQEAGPSTSKEGDTKEGSSGQGEAKNSTSGLDSIGEKESKMASPSSMVALNLKSSFLSSPNIVQIDEDVAIRKPLRVPRIKARGIGCTPPGKEEDTKKDVSDASDEGSRKRNLSRKCKDKDAASNDSKEASNGSDGADKRTKGRQSRFSDLPDPKSQHMPIKLKLMKDSAASDKKSDSKTKKKKKEPDSDEEDEEGFKTRLFYDNERFCYVMDAKSMGNLGRYLNHNCAPNVFVQNVFVDTHDMRFPWVAFFAGQYIRAGTELTWDYNYEVGSVPGKVLYCYCGAAECRGRLL